MIRIPDIFRCFLRYRRYLLSAIAFLTAFYAIEADAGMIDKAKELFMEEYSHDEYLKYCKSEVFDKKYAEGGCWSCSVVKTLMYSMTSLIAALTGPVLELSKLIMLYGAAIWLAIYFLKSLSSFAMQDPAKIIDGAMAFMFKWAVVYTLLYLGIGEIVKMIVNPLLSIGWDIGHTFAG